MSKSKIMKVSPEFASLVDSYYRDWNEQIEKLLGMKFKDSKPIKKTTVTKLVAKKMKDKGDLNGLEINYKKGRFNLKL